MSGMFTRDEENPDLMFAGSDPKGGGPSTPAQSPDVVSGAVGYAKSLWDSATNSPAPLLGVMNIPNQVAVDTGASPPPPKATPGTEAGPNEHDEAIRRFALGQEDGAGDNSHSSVNPYTKTPYVVAGTSSQATQATPPPIKGEEKDVARSQMSGTSNRIIDATQAAGEADKDLARQRAIGAGDEAGYQQAIADTTAESEEKLRKNAKAFSDFSNKIQQDYQAAMKTQVEDTPAQTFFKTIGNIMGTIGYSLIAKSGRPELAAQMMDKALEREYRAQQDQKAEKGKKLGEIQNSLGFFEKTSGDERMGHLMWEEAAIRKYVQQAKAAAANANTKEGWAAYERVAAGADLRLAATQRQIQNAMQVYGRNYAGNLAGGGFDTNNPGKIGKIDGPAAQGAKTSPAQTTGQPAGQPAKSQGTVGNVPIQAAVKSKDGGVPPMLARDAPAQAAPKVVDPKTDLTPNERSDIKSYKTKPDTFNIVNFSGTARPFLVPKESDSPEVRQEIQTGGEAKDNLRKFAGAYAAYKKAANNNFGMTDILRSNRDPAFTAAEADFKARSGLLLQQVAKLYDPKSAVRDADVEFAMDHTGLMMQGKMDKLRSTFQSQEAIDAATAKSIKTLSNFVDTKMEQLRKSRGIVKGTRVIVKLDKNNNLIEPTPEEMRTMKSGDNNSLREYIRPDIADSTLETK